MELPFDRTLFKQALSSGDISWRKHSLERMFARNISRVEVLEVIENGEVIQQYEGDKPFSSALLLGFPNARPIHVVISFDETQPEIFVITAPDFKTRK